MAGVGGLSSLGLFLLLLLASSSAAREERSPRDEGWKNVEEIEKSKYNYLALLKVGVDAKCSGSIPSKWTVLTFCGDVTDASKTTAYANVFKVGEATDSRKGDIEVRDVKTVAANTNVKGLKICMLKEPWTEKVGVVKSAVKGQSSDLTGCTLLGFGAAGGEAQKLIAQTLAQCTPQTAGELCLPVANANKQTHSLRTLDLGGPAVCGDEQRGINKELKAGTGAADSTNVFLDVAEYSPWIEEQKQAAEESGASGGTGGTGGNGTSPSSGYSIHSHLNKYSNWKVLWFLVPTIVTFLQY